MKYILSVQEFLGRLALIQNIDQFNHSLPFLVFELNLFWVLLGIRLEIGGFVAEL